MAELVTVRALGVTVGIDVDAERAREVRSAWARALAEDEPQVVVPAPEAYPGALSQLSVEVTRAAIDHQAGRLWMLHAAGLADPATGRTVALVGPTGAGKSTAVRTHGARFGYVTDETVGVTEGGRVLPYPKPVSVIEGGRYPKRQVPPDELGLLPAPADLRLAAVVVLDRDGTSAPEAEDVRRAAALPLLAEHTSHLARFARPLRHLAALLEGVAVRRVRYAESADLGDLLAELVGEP